uniref:Cytochrome P450 CYP6AX1v2 n=1 Tax=Nilaparvata lugens TaxID=108931 RepID=A0A0K0LB91_NILLU|nr:cytochrome P450 CYP6AX1v2 [Nilaparvata lugens]AIW79981.1 cytochrome P450 CYP6AX1v2 [Nilaparvata lugens]
MNAFGYEVSWFDIFFLVVSLVSIIYYFGINTFSHWEKKGIKFMKPVPFFGNTLDLAMGRQHITTCHQVIYDYFADDAYGGWFANRSPLLMVKDPELIQQILVKDFVHFYDRGTTVDMKLDPLNANLLNMTGQRWKALRQKLTPAFSSGKLKLMSPQFNECVDDLCGLIDEKSNKKELIDVQESMSKLATDVIGSCAFGLQFNSLKNPESEFRRMGRDILRPSWRFKVRTFMRVISDSLPSLLGVKAFDKSKEDFFINLVNDTMKYREDNKVERNDFIQILMNLKKIDENMEIDPNNESHVILDDKLLAANTFIFFIAGFETTATTLTFSMYELAVNQEIQDKLRQEVQTTFEKYGAINYDSTKDMDYLDRVISETLRKYPIAGSLIRRCTKAWQVPGAKGKLEVGDRVVIPVYPIHHDPKYYPEPQKFDPERFTEENKRSRPPCTYMPFGDGPRICIGARFALQELKTTLSSILLHYKLTLNEKSKATLPLKMKPRRILMQSEQEIYINFTKIK